MHHWNPKGNGLHQSLRPDPTPRLYALQDQLLCLRRLGAHQGVLNIHERQVQPINQATAHALDICVVTDGENGVLHLLEEPYRGLAKEVVVEPKGPMYLGFEAHKVLAGHLDDQYDLYGYLEDDLLINDPFFFHKIDWFRRQLDDNGVLLPHRYEPYRQPHKIDKLYIDGPVDPDWLKCFIPSPPKPILATLPAGEIIFNSPGNPHAGCFFLSHFQMTKWTKQDCFLDEDVSYVSPLESAATLGIIKTFDVYKSAISHANWLEVQHWGNSFRSLIGKQVSPMKEQTL